MSTMLPVSLAAGFVFALITPTSTSSLAFFPSVFLWSSHVYLSAASYAVVGFLAARTQLPDPVPVVLAMSGVVVLLPVFSLGIELGFGTLDEDLSTLGGLPLAYWEEWIDVAPQSVAAAVLFSFFLFRQVVTEASAVSPLEAGNRAVELPGRLPPVAAAHGLGTEENSVSMAPQLAELLPGLPATLGNDVLSMSAQDHYVEIVTSKGRHLLPGRLSDCVEALAEIEGAQCHRSHWVALDHVQDIQRDGSAYTCVLSDGRRIPVSRRRAAPLRAELAQRRPV